MSIKEIEGGKVLRLWATEALAKEAANLMGEDGWVPQLHNSQNGYLITKEATGERFDAAGWVQ